MGKMIKPEPLTISRTFAAPRELVFKAWSSAEHIKNWFSPETYTTPDAEIDFRPGGVCNICMRSPEGHESWSRGHFIEISPPDRLVLTFGVAFGGEVKFTVHTTVTFAEEGKGARMTVHQDYEIYDENFMGAVKGAAEGWRTTLDKLEKELARMQTTQNRNVVHGVFTLERTYNAPPARVYHALTDMAAKTRWFAGGEDQTVLRREMDVRPGGREHVSGRWKSGMVSVFDAIYYDVVPNERLVYCYEMHLDDRKISVSLATIQLKPAGTGTKLTVTEQGAFLDGYDDAGAREHGTGFLLDRLGASLQSA